MLFSLAVIGTVFLGKRMPVAAPRPEPELPAPGGVQGVKGGVS